MTVNNPPVFDQITSSTGAITGDELLTSNDTEDYDGLGAGYRIKCRVYHFTNLNMQNTINYKSVAAPELAGKTILGISSSFSDPFYNEINGNTSRMRQSGYPGIAVYYTTDTQLLVVQPSTVFLTSNMNINDIYVIVYYT